MKWGAPLVTGLGLLAAIIVGRTSEWYFGVAVIVVIWATFFIWGYSAARCPHCGQVWWSAVGALRVGYGGYAPTEDETESMVCRRCRIDIGLAMREP